VHSIPDELLIRELRAKVIDNKISSLMTAICVLLFLFTT